MILTILEKVLEQNTINIHSVLSEVQLCVATCIVPAQTARIMNYVILILIQTFKFAANVVFFY